MKGIIKTKDGVAFVCKELGGSGSGNFGHAGVPGERGGSSPGSGGGGDDDETYNNAVSESDLQSKLGPGVTTKKMDAAFGGQAFWDEETVQKLQDGKNSRFDTFSGATSKNSTTADIIYGEVIGGWGDSSTGVTINGGKTIADAEHRPQKFILFNKNDGDVPPTDWTYRLKK